LTPDFDTVTETRSELKVAVTARAAVMETVQVPAPVQAPLQPAKVAPVPATAFSVTEVPAS
jgi:hypothetical protein